MKTFNDPSKKELRKNLRNNMPDAEIVLWSKLKGKQLNGKKFRRQYGIGTFIVDFYCSELKLAIEVDGDSHFIGDKPKLDKERQSFIESEGVRVLRFTNNEIYKNLDGVLRTIEKFIGE